MTSITQASLRYVQELGTFLGPQNRTQGRCDIYYPCDVSGLAYVGEKDEEGTMFDSMPTALYWAIITMTSVGYGDIYPVSWFGRLVASGQT